MLVIKHCYDNVPYYRDLFKSINLNPKDIKTINDMDKIPILTKKMVRKNEKRLIAENYQIKKLTKVHTSGSTGIPLKLYDSKKRQEYLIAGLWRVYRRCGWKPGEPIATIWGFNQKKDKISSFKKNIKSFLTGITYLNAWKANNEDFKEWYHLLKRRKVKIIVCYASSGSRFAKWLLDNDIKLDKIKGVYSTSEKLYDAQKKQMEEAFQCQVFNLYGCGEVLHIGCSCESGQIHINQDMCIVETSTPDVNGNTSLIVTGLRNKAMPFLRYMNGDSIEFTNSNCTCGRNTPTIGLQITRLSDIFKFANGKEFPSLYFILRLYKPGFDGIELFQYHQDRIDHILLKIVKNSKFNKKTDSNLLKLINEIEEHIEFQANVELKYVDYIEQSKTSKHYYAKSDITNQKTIH